MIDKNSVLGLISLDEVINDTGSQETNKESSLIPVKNEVSVFESDEEIEPFNLQEAMNGVEIKYQRIKMPSGGGLVFEFGDQFAKQLECVIILFHRTNSLYLTKLEDKLDTDDKLPDCYSKDSIKGVDKHTGEVKDCSNCPYNRFDSEISCANKFRLYLQLATSEMPVIFDLPPTSIKAFSNYINESITPRKLWSYQALTVIELEKKESKNKQVYSSAKFTFKGQIQKNTALEMQRKHKSLKAVL